MKKILLTTVAEKDAVEQKVLSFQEDGQQPPGASKFHLGISPIPTPPQKKNGQHRKMVIKIEFTPLSVTDCKILPFLKIEKKLRTARLQN